MKKAIKGLDTLMSTKEICPGLKLEKLEIQNNNFEILHMAISLMGTIHALELTRSVLICILMGGDWHDGYLKTEVSQALMTRKISDERCPGGHTY